MLQPGTSMAVKVDPEDRDQVIMDWQGQADQSMAIAGQAMQSGGVTTSQDPVERLERLQALKDKGLLTDAELKRRSSGSSARSDRRGRDHDEGVTWACSRT